MSYVIEQTKAKIKLLEDSLNDPETTDYFRQHLPKSIETYKRKLEILEKTKMTCLKLKMI